MSDATPESAGHGHRGGGRGSGRPWREDERLAGAFHAEHPDDLRVRFHFTAQQSVEAMWVTVTGVDAEVGGYTGRLGNRPHTEGCGVGQGDRVSFRMAKGSREPIWVGPAIRETLRDWSVDCPTCGFDMLVEPIEELLGPRFVQGLGADAPHTVLGVSCRMCRNPVTVRRRR